MQPYFLPYIGYFQLINAVDEFIVYDNIQFSKKGWFHRNRMLQNGQDVYFSLPLKKGSDYLNVYQRELSESWPGEKEKLLRKIRENYRKAPFFSTSFPLAQEVIEYKENNLFLFLFNAIKAVCNNLEIKTPLTISSSLAIDHSLKGQEKVIELAKSIGATSYLNPIGGLDLYQNNVFLENSLDLSFHKALPIVYQQFGADFVPWLSILDLLMFNEKKQIIEWLNAYEIIVKDE